MFGVSPTEVTARSPGRVESAPIASSGNFSLKAGGYLRATWIWIIPPIPFPTVSEILVRFDREPTRTYVIRYRESGSHATVYRFLPNASRLVRDDVLNASVRSITRQHSANPSNRENEVLIELTENPKGARAS